MQVGLVKRDDFHHRRDDVVDGQFIYPVLDPNGWAHKGDLFLGATKHEMAGRKKSREVAGPMMGEHQSVDGNDKSLPRPPRKSARIAATAKSNDGPS